MKGFPWYTVPFLHGLHVCLLVDPPPVLCTVYHLSLLGILSGHFFLTDFSPEPREVVEVAAFSGDHEFFESCFQKGSIYQYLDQPRTWIRG